jgi:hypothetical protein
MMEGEKSQRYNSDAAADKERVGGLGPEGETQGSQ